jgi:alpha-amylase
MKKQIYNLRKLILSIMLIAMFVPVKSQAPSQSTDVMLQGFGWDTYAISNWSSLTTAAPEIGANFDMIWLPQSGNDLTSNTMGYLPVYLFDQNSSFGTENELKTLIQTLNINGVKAIADVVINHRNGETNWVDFPSETYNGNTYSWGLDAICEDDEVKDQELSYDHIPQGNPDTGENYGAARDVDHTNVNVQNTIKAYLDFLKNEIGYEGWRYDLVKGYAGNYTEMYNNSAHAHLSVGEFWDGNYDYVTGWIDATNATSTAFDFPQKYALNAAFNNGYDLTELVWKRNGTLNQPAGLVHSNYYNRYAITFVDNHDTGRSDNPSRFTGNVLAAYAYILSNPGIPCVWMNHWNDDNYKTKINELIAARRHVEIHNESEITVNRTSADLYVATSVGLSGSLIVKIGTGTYAAPTDYELQTSGTDYAVWTKSDSAPNPDPGDPVTVMFYAENTGWTNVNIYAWDASGALNDWPGDAATDEGENWYSYTVSEVTGNLNAIFNNGNQQITDILNITADACFSTLTTQNNDEKYPHVTIDCNDGTTTAPISVGFENTGAWPEVYIYSWDAYGNKLTGEWPGSEATDENASWYHFDFDPSVSHVNVIINNNNGVQTANIEGITASSCYSFTSNGAAADLTECPSPVTTITMTEPAKPTVNIFPNPVKDYINIIAPNKLQKVTIGTMNGTITDIITDLSEDNQFDVSHLNPGIYFISIKGEKLLKPEKLIVY